MFINVVPEKKEKNENPGVATNIGFMSSFRLLIKAMAMIDVIGLISTQLRP